MLLRQLEKIHAVRGPFLDFCEEHGIKTWDYLRDAHLSLAWHKMFLFEHHEELIWKRGRTVFKIEPEGFLYRFSRYDIITREPAWVYHKDYAFMCPSLKPERMFELDFNLVHNNKYEKGDISVQIIMGHTAVITQDNKQESCHISKLISKLKHGYKVSFERSFEQSV